MAVPVAAIGAGIGLAAQGINMYMSARDRRRAERALAAMGKRPTLQIPQQIMEAYNRRLQRYNAPQGYSEQELGAMRGESARRDFTLFNRARGLGSSAAATQALAANARASYATSAAARNAEMKRAQQSSDLAAMDQLSGQMGRYGFMSQQDVLGNYDLTAERYGAAISTQKENMANMIAGIGQFGATAGVSPELWSTMIG